MSLKQRISLLTKLRQIIPLALMDLSKVSFKARITRLFAICQINESARRRLIGIRWSARNCICCPQAFSWPQIRQGNSSFGTKITCDFPSFCRFWFELKLSGSWWLVEHLFRDFFGLFFCQTPISRPSNMQRKHQHVNSI